MTSSEQARIAHALAEQYVIEDEVGAGGMATVYLARDRKHERRVAVKVLLPEIASVLGRERFLREIRIAAQLHHPHILQLYDSGEVDGQLYYVMPYVDGQSLRDRMRLEGHLPIAEAARILRDVADALSYAHSQGVVHRDIKPDNVMLEGRHAVVADFGIAKALHSSNTTAALTSTGLAIGTPSYMAPEQAMGAEQIDARADLYAFGVMGYEMLAGCLPFDAANAQQALAMVVTEEPEPVDRIRAEIPVPLATLIMRCLEKDPGDRWQTADELLPSLEEIATPSAGLTPTALRPAPVLRIPIPGTRGRLGIAAAAIGLFAAASWIAFRPDTLPTSTTPAPAQQQLTFTGDVRSVAASPDGEFIAYKSVTDKSQVLTVLDLAGGSVILHETTDDLTSLGWSPDGREVLATIWSVASSAGAVYAFPRVGGPGRRLPGVGNSQFTVDGRQIVSYATNAKGLHFTSLADGTKSYLALQQPDTWMMAIAQHPGGDAFAVATSDGNNGRNTLWLVGTDSSQRYGVAPQSPDAASLITHDMRNFGWGDAMAYRVGWQRQVAESPATLISPMFTATGDALYYLESKLPSFDLKRIDITADLDVASRSSTVMSAIDIFREGSGTPISITRDNRRLFYTKGFTYSNLVRVQVNDGEAVVDGITTGTAYDWGPSVSPDGTRIAYLSATAATQDVYVVTTGGANRTRLTHLDSVAASPDWSPDGRRIAFGVRRGSAVRLAIIGVNDQSDLRVFGETDVSEQVVWGPGSQLMYKMPENRNWMVFDTEMGTNVGPLLPVDSAELGWVLSAAYSPDAREIAIFWNRNDNRLQGLYTIDRETGTILRLMSGPIQPMGYSHDSQSIYAYDWQGRTLLRVHRDGTQSRLIATVTFQPSPMGGTLVGDGSAFVLPIEEAQADAWVIENFDPERGSRD